MIQPQVGQTWELCLPAKPNEKFKVNIMSVDVMDFTCVIASPGMGWTDRVSWEFLSDAGTLVQK